MTASPRPPAWLVAPALVAAGLALLWLVLRIPTPDLAAQVYRTTLFEREGFTLFNAHWFGGHHTPGYSLLFPPLAALLGPRVVGALAAVVSAVLFTALVRRHFGDRAWPGAVWFGAATATDLFIGRLTFGLGVSLALAALLALQRERPRAAVVLAALTTAASPVAGLFLALVAGAVWLHRRRAADLGVAAGAFAPALVLSLAFPEGGTMPWGSLSFLAVAGLTALVAWLVPAGERALRTGVLLYGAAALAAFVVSSPMGSNATRLVALAGGPLLLCALLGQGRLTRARAPVVVATFAALLAYQWWAPVRETLKGATDRSHEAAFYAPLLGFLEGRADAATRVEIPFTRMHWEAVHVARRFPLARGWETQLDVKYNRLFFPGDRRLTAARYRRWLHEHGVRFVALPDAPLDPAGRREARLIASEPPFLRLVHRDRHWRVYEVRGHRGLAGGQATVQRLGPSSFTLRARRPGPVLVRVRWTPYWRVTAGAACVSRGRDDWTTVTARRAGTVRVEARFSPRRVVDRGPSCSSAVASSR
jgi:hypothetical protein